MGIGKTNAAGGGASLNFDVKAYATKEALLAAVPKENTIGVITTTPITGWIFAAAESAVPMEGMVWFPTGTSSAVEFNALKKNAIQVYPMSAKQYVDGAWVSVTAMSYQGGEWVNWITYLYSAPNEYTDLTGGWTSDGYALNSTGIAQISKTEDGIRLNEVSGKYSAVTHAKLIDLTAYSWLYVKHLESEQIQVRLTTNSSNLSDSASGFYGKFDVVDKEGEFYKLSIKDVVGSFRIAIFNPGLLKEVHVL